MRKILCRLAAGPVIAGLALMCSAAIASPQAHAASSSPHGITLSGLQTQLQAGSAESPAISDVSFQGMRAQIAATAGFWHASTVRLQVEQDKLVGATGHVYSPAYMQDIRSMVSYARSLGLTVVINAQTEPAPGFAANEPLPDYATRVFWAQIDKVYKNRPGIVYDIFNEPRGGADWGQWRPAMQSVVSSIRASGARNTIWVEGINWAATLAGVPMLHGSGIVYTYHHPAGPATKASWHRDFGYLTGRVRVVDGEWAGCQAPPAGYLKYLSAHRVGLTSWTLEQGSLSTAGGYSTATPAGQALRAWW